jgi:hypothetical protein
MSERGSVCVCVCVREREGKREIRRESKFDTKATEAI